MRVAVLDDIHNAYERTAGVARLLDVLLAWLDGLAVPRSDDPH